MSPDLSSRLHSHPPRNSASPDSSAFEAAARLFRALADPHRLAILVRLRDGELCVGELAAESGVEISTLSQRLRVLRGEALLARRRDGKHILYSLADDHVRELVLNALAHAAEHRTPNPSK